MVGSSRFLEIRRVARVTGRGHRLELACRRAFMAGVAVYSSVCPGQWKAVVMQLDLLDGNLPAANAMALLAIRPELALVDIGVTVLASFSDIREYGLYVTLDARDGLVHPTQRVSGLTVIELWNGPHGFPAGSRVTVLTRHIQIAMRAVGAGGHLCLCACRYSGKRKQHNCDQLENAPRPRHDLPLARSLLTQKNGMKNEDE